MSLITKIRRMLCNNNTSAGEMFVAFPYLCIIFASHYIIRKKQIDDVRLYQRTERESAGRCALQRRPLAGDRGGGLGEDPRADLQDSLAAGERLPAVEHPGPDLYEQGGARDEDAHRTAGGSRTGTLGVDGNVPQPLPAHPACRSRCAGLHTSVHHLRHGRQQEPDTLHRQGDAARREGL